MTNRTIPMTHLKTFRCSSRWKRKKKKNKVIKVHLEGISRRMNKTMGVMTDKTQKRIRK
jgi:hypothetical protein